MLKLDKSTWRRVKLGEVVKSSKGRVDPTSGEIDRYIAGEHMDSDDLRIHRWGEVGDKDLGPAFHRRFHPGQVLYGSRRTYLRKVSVAEFNGVCANTTFVLETSDKDALLQEFLPFVMTSEPFHAYAIAESKGSVNPYVNWSDIAKFEFGLPPLDEQKRIADLLWAVERHMQAVRDVSAASWSARMAYLNSRILEMLGTTPVALSTLWSKSPESGWSQKPVDAQTGHFVLSLSALGDKGYVSGQLKPVDMTDKVAATRLRAGDVLISRANTQLLVGRSGIYDEERSDISFPDTMMRLHFDDSVVPAFAVEVINSAYGRAYMRQVAAGSATSMVKINRQTLGRFPFPKVGQDSQVVLIDNLSTFDSSLDALATEHESTNRVRASLLSSIFGDN